MKLYNTLTGKIDKFAPIDPKNVKVYTCGPTVYSYQHIGNYTAYIYWDILVRTLRLNGFVVNRVMNLTDVGHLVSDRNDGEDKMEKGARLSGKSVWEVAEFFGDDFLTNFTRLNLISPTKIYKATDCIEEDLDLIRALKLRGYTYETSDGIYYDTSKFPTYADFAHLNLEKLRAGARVEFNQEKRNVSDFALWKIIKKGEKHDMQWQTPKDLWESEAMGYPGWHTECAAIIKTEFGDGTIDIHTGGIDHIPIHHTNEIAESEAISGVRLANYWLHCNFITIDGQKISKSLGNIYTFKDLAERDFSHLDFKMWVIQGHFTSERNFLFEGLAAAKTRLKNWRNWASLRHQQATAGKKKEIVSDDFGILKALNDNLNSAKALSIIDGIISRDDAVPTEDFLGFLDDCFGLELCETTPNISPYLQNILKERAIARLNKDFAKSDKLRQQLLKKGIDVLDTANGQIWQYHH
ncbi:MAG: cysteine--tRNA ligase [Candidatus Nomurabacteria bacterium]|jgi:cysteinyl-tRNA synthetase|nr:cysteine--tRNA ligase [Candidatus Nomurabacteria bacterium]